jgi:hypothetical protein
MGALTCCDPALAAFDLTLMLAPGRISTLNGRAALMKLK